MNTSAPEPQRARFLPIVIGVAIGAILGFAIGAGAYLLLDPWLESSSSPLREMQGFAFNLVPGLTLIGGGLGAWWGVRRNYQRGGAGSQ